MKEHEYIMNNLIKFRVWDGKDKKMMPVPAVLFFTNDNQRLGLLPIQMK